MLDAQLQIRKLMGEELLRLRTKNPQYSLRSFARRLKLYPSTISELLSGRRRVTPKMAQKILNALAIPPFEAQALTQKCKRTQESKPPTTPEYIQLTMDQFHIVSDWFYFAVLSLAELEDFKDDPQWISRRLGIPIPQAKLALERLKRLELLERGTNGKLTPTGAQFTTTTDVADLSVRKGHFQNLDLARESLERDDVLVRDFSEITMAIDPAKLPLAKERIRKFRRELCAELEASPKKEVYRMCIQLFPLTKNRTGE